MSTNATVSQDFLERSVSMVHSVIHRMMSICAEMVESVGEYRSIIDRYSPLGHDEFISQKNPRRVILCNILVFKRSVDSMYSLRKKVYNV